MNEFVCWAIVALEFVTGFFFFRWLVHHNNNKKT
jgi:hypothetical protein